MRRVALFARREFAAYACTLSFWAALLMGPVLLSLATFALNAGAAHKPAARLVGVEASQPDLRAAAVGSLRAAAQLQNQTVHVVDHRVPGGAFNLRISASGGNRVAVEVLEGQPSNVTLALLQRDLAAAAQRNALRASGASAASLASQDVAVAIDQRSARRGAGDMDPGRITRFALTFLLWINLVGALGMLLQAIVRERANKSMQILLASARPADIVYGKLIGVGLLSLLVVVTWLGAAAGLALVAARGDGASAAKLLLHAFTDGPLLLRAGTVYLLAFAMYGCALMGLGALARDGAAAQNLSRPMFAVLLIAFFVALGQATGSVQTSPWLVWLPPFAPFALLMADPGATSICSTAFSFAVMALTAAGLGMFACAALIDDSWRTRLRRLLRPKTYAAPAGGI